MWSKKKGNALYEFNMDTIRGKIRPKLLWGLRMGTGEKNNLRRQLQSLLFSQLLLYLLYHSHFEAQRLFLEWLERFTLPA